MFDTHQHVGRAFDAFGGELGDGGSDGAEVARVSWPSGSGSWTKAGSGGREATRQCFFVADFAPNVAVGHHESHLLPQIVECGLHSDAKAAIRGGNGRRPFGAPAAT